MARQDCWYSQLQSMSFCVSACLLVDVGYACSFVEMNEVTVPGLCLELSCELSLQTCELDMSSPQRYQGFTKSGLPEETACCSLDTDLPPKDSVQSDEGMSMSACAQVDFPFATSWFRPLFCSSSGNCPVSYGNVSW